MNRDLARAVLVVLCLYLVVAGVVLAWTTPPLSGGTIAAVGLIGLGGGVIVRIRHVQIRRGL